MRLPPPKELFRILKIIAGTILIIFGVIGLFFPLKVPLVSAYIVPYDSPFPALFFILFGIVVLRKTIAE